MSHWFSLFSSWFRPPPKEETSPAEQLSRLWTAQEAGHRIAFISVVLNTDSSSANDIKDIGLSVWRKAGFVDTISKHWRIQDSIDTIDTNDIVEFGNPDSFDFGSTQPIRQVDIRTVLDDWTLSVAGDCEEVCLVVYGKQQTAALWENWKPPVPVVFLDIEMVWRSRHDGSIGAPFEEVGSSIAVVADSTSDITHAGNQAHCLLILLRGLGGQTDIL